MTWMAQNKKMQASAKEKIAWWEHLELQSDASFLQLDKVGVLYSVYP
jgi:hypothetical protein